MDKLTRGKLIELAQRMRAGKNELVLAAMIMDELGFSSTSKVMKKVIDDISSATNTVDRLIE